MAKALWINSETKEIIEVDIKQGQGELRDMQYYVGGYIRPVMTLPTYRDLLYVDDEGLFKKPEYFFMIADYMQPLAGNGLVTGEEIYNADDDSYTLSDVVISIDSLKMLITFVDRKYVIAWSKANASEISSAIYSVEEDGSVKTRMVQRYGKLFSELLKKDDE